MSGEVATGRTGATENEYSTRITEDSIFMESENRGLEAEDRSARLRQTASRSDGSAMVVARGANHGRCSGDLETDRLRRDDVL